MSWPALALIALAVVVGLLGPRYRKRKSKLLPDVSRKDFLAGLSLPAGLFQEDELLAARSRVAKELAVPGEKLSPEQTLSDLASVFDYLGDLRVGWGDLEFELVELRDDAGLEKYEPWPTTVGEFVVELARAEQLRQARERSDR